MKIFSIHGVQLQSGAPFEANDKAYPWNWFDLNTDEEIQAEGFTIQVVPDVEIL